MTCIKEFEVREGSTENMDYLIEVFFRSALIDSFCFPTMREAKQHFEHAGYKLTRES
jgi:hypothetical protein